MPNLGLAVGLQDSPIGNTKARYLLASTHIPPPTKHAMQHLSNKVSDIITKLNTGDMKNRREQLKKLNLDIAGREYQSISMDARYNSAVYGSRHKCGQNASQAIMSVISQDGKEKEILDLFITNKLCWYGAWLRSRGYKCRCPGHIGCTANIERTATVSEHKMGLEIGRRFGLEGTLIKYACTDGDARSCEGLQEGLQESNPAWTVLRQSDTTHLGMSQMKKIVKSKFSRSFFSSHLRTKSERDDLQRNLGEDIRTKCEITLRNLHREYHGSVVKMSVRLPKLVATMLECYSGDHMDCKLRDYGVLTGCKGGKSKNWMNSSHYFTTLPYKVVGFEMTASDAQLLREVIRMKLGRESIKLVAHNLNTNKNEAIHRGYSASVPKNVKYSRNVYGRVHSAADRLNNLVGNSLHKKLQAVGAPIPKGGRVAKSVKQMQKEVIYHKNYQTQKKVVGKKNHQKKVQRFEYNQTKAQKKAKDVYKSGQLDTSVANSTRKKPRKDHTYTQSYCA